MVNSLPKMKSICISVTVFHVNLAQTDRSPPILLMPNSIMLACSELVWSWFVPNSITLAGLEQFGAGQRNGNWSLACSELVRSQLRTSSEQASVMEFSFYSTSSTTEPISCNKRHCPVIDRTTFQTRQRRKHSISIATLSLWFIYYR